MLLRSSRSARRAAFTMVELLIALAILALIVGLAVTNLDKIFGQSQGTVARIFVSDTLKTPLTAYRIAMGNYPSTNEGLQALITAPANNNGRWAGPYIEAPGGKLPTDPWGELYIYRYPGTKNKGSFDVLSKGPDKTEGTDDDIGNW